MTSTSTAPAAARALADRSSSSPGVELADVDRARDHLDAPLLADPPHRDRRVEPTRVRQHNSLAPR